MAGNKKPSKKYRPREVVKPLNIRNVWDTEGDIHAALLAMEDGSLDGSHIAHLAAHAQIMMHIHKEGPINVQSKSMIRTLPALIAASNLAIYRASTTAMHIAEKNGGYL